MKVIKKIFVVLFFCLALGIGVSNTAYAQTNSGEVSNTAYAKANSNEITPMAAYHYESFTVTYWQERIRDLKFAGVLAGTLTCSVQIAVTETWLVDDYGNKIEYVSSSSVIKDGVIERYAVSPPYSVESLEGKVSSTGSKYIITYKLTTTKGGTSYDTITIYP